MNHVIELDYLKFITGTQFQSIPNLASDCNLEF
jgi:hypothetical protein